MPKPLGEPQTHVGGLGLLLDRVAASAGKEFEEAIASFGIRNLHLGILSTIERFGPLPQIRIGEYLGIERQSMANLVDELERLELVERTKVPEDRRVWAVAITTAGRRVQAQAGRAGGETAVRIFRDLTEADCELLENLLTKLSRNGRYPNLFVDPTTQRRS
jgi:MarR family transcriptional regulator, lower aerobic nicotinate degradation pathway regulator